MFFGYDRPRALLHSITASFSDMVLVRKCAPKELTVAELEGVLERFMAARGTRDLCSTLKNLELGVSWKNAPRAAVLAEYNDIYKMLAVLSPQGVLPAKRFAMAFEATHKTRPTNFSAKTLTVFGDEMSALIRCGLSKFRALVTDGEAHRRCFAKASEDERCKIEEVMNLMSIEGIHKSYTAPPSKSASEVPALCDLERMPATKDFTFESIDDVGSFLDNFESRLDSWTGATRSAPSSAMSCDSARSRASTVLYCDSIRSDRTAEEVDQELLRLAATCEQVDIKGKNQPRARPHVRGRKRQQRRKRRQR